MIRSLVSLALPWLLLMACQEAPTSAPPETDRELGTVESIYPHYTAAGEWLLEYRLTWDTVFVDYGTARGLAGDSAWKHALTRNGDTFYDNGDGCMYTRSVTGCLPFVESPEDRPSPASGP